MSMARVSVAEHSRLSVLLARGLLHKLTGAVVARAPNNAVAHYNLGCLWLEQNQPDAARTEFTAYTLRRNNDPVGWVIIAGQRYELREGPPLPNVVDLFG